MTFARRALVRTSIAVTVVLAVALAGVASLPAQPAGETRPAQATAPAEAPQRHQAGPVTVSLDASSNAIPVGGEFRFGVAATAREKVDYLQLRMRLFMPGSRDLIYQKTFVEQSLEDTSVAVTFERTIKDIGLDPGAYPVEVSVRTSASGEITETVLPTRLLVFDPKADPVRLSVIARVSAQPMADADGRFVVDPAEYARARDEVAALAEYALLNPTARLGLAASPMMLQEWRRIAGGYRFAGPEGEISISANDTVPRLYASCLDTLERAVASGRLELLALGYSDPDPSELEAADLGNDVPTQYRWGRRAIVDATGITPSGGMAPAGGALPPTAAKPLAENGLEYVAVDARRAKRKDKSVAPGAYTTGKAGPAVLATDREVAQSLEASSAAELRATVFEHALGDAKKRSLPVVVEVGPGGVRAERLVTLLRGLDAQRWVVLQLPAQAAAAKGATVTLRGHRADADAPEDFWETVSSARSWSRALGFALGLTDESAVTAVRNSLIAESSVWSGFQGDWTPAGRGLAYAASAQRSAERVLERVDLKARPVTMAGATGRVPVTITNDNEREVRVVLVAEPGESAQLLSNEKRVLILQPGENFVEVPVRLNGTLRSDVKLSLEAAGLELAETTVRLSASYLDRIAIVVGLVLVLAVLLYFIVKRVRTAEATADSDDDDGER